MAEETPQEPVETPQEPVETPTEPEQPQYLTVDKVNELLEERERKTMQSLQTWLGRRDAELFQKLEESKTTHDPDQSREKLLEDPDKFFDQQLRRFEERNAKYLNSVMGHAGRYMESDQLYTDKEFGGAVIKEISRIANDINRSLPPDIAAERLVERATLNVMKQQRSKPKNPLEGRQPATGIGSESPTGPTQTKTVKLPEMSERTRKMAEKWGYDKEGLAKVFK